VTGGRQRRPTRDVAPTATVGSAPCRPAGTSSGARRLILLGPGLGWLGVFLVVPLTLILAYSFFERGAFGGIVFAFTLDNYLRAVDPLYLSVLFFSVRVALVTTALALMIGYAVAYFIATRSARWRTPLLVLILLPFWTSFLIRTYAWIVILNREGLINGPLVALGIVGQPVPLLYNELAIVVGLVYGYLPLMVLPLYAAIERLNPELREAASDLGAPAWKVFLTVTLPLTLTGIGAGCVFVFVPSLGNFIVPDLLGGGKSIMIGNLIQSEFLKARDWPFGATLSLVLIVMLLALLFVQARLVSRDRTLGVSA
jgi:spermidine/putrescine transport system permease protein